jgi:hypothetical protein
LLLRQFGFGLGRESRAGNLADLPWVEQVFESQL